MPHGLDLDWYKEIRVSNEPATVWEGAKSPHLWSWTPREIHPRNFTGIEMTQEYLPYTCPQLVFTSIYNFPAF